MAYDAFISYSHAADGALAPALRKALRGMARPWYRTRALNVFLDETNLSATEDLPAAIKTALAGSRYFLHLASPQAAKSKWVGEELSAWQGAHGHQRLLIALTDGDIVWDKDAGDFDNTLSSAIHPALRRVFESEPLWVDLRWAKSQANLSPRDPRFQQATAMLAAPMHGKGVDELVGDDVRAHRRTRFAVTSVVAGLLGLMLLLSGTALVATRTSTNLQSKLSLIETILPFFDNTAPEDDQPIWATLWPSLVRLFTPLSAVESSVVWGRERLAVKEDCVKLDGGREPDARFECPTQDSDYAPDGLRNDIEGLREIAQSLVTDLNSGRVARLMGEVEDRGTTEAEVDSAATENAESAEAESGNSSVPHSESTLELVRNFAAIVLPEPLWTQVTFKTHRGERDADDEMGRYFTLYTYPIPNGELRTELVLIQLVNVGYCGSAGCTSPSLGYLRRGSDYTLVWVNPYWGRVILYSQGVGKMPWILTFGTSQSGASNQFRQVVRYDFSKERGYYESSLRGQIESTQTQSDPGVPALIARPTTAQPGAIRAKP